MIKVPNRKTMRGMMNILRSVRRGRSTSPADLVRSILAPLGLSVSGQNADEMLKSLEDECQRQGESSKFDRARQVVTEFLKERGETKITSLANATDLVADLMDACGQHQMADLVTVASAAMDDGGDAPTDSPEADNG